MAGFSEAEMDGVLRLDIDGRLDAAGVDAIDAPLTASLRNADRDVVLDLARVPFVGSLGIRLLVSAARTLQRSGRTLVLMAAQPQVLDVFETVSLGDLIPIVADAAEARQKLAA